MVHFGGHSMIIPRRRLLHLAAAQPHGPCSPHGQRASLSVAAGAFDRSCCGRRLARHHRAPDRRMAVGSARPAVRRRQPAGRRRQYRHRGRRPRAARRLHADAGHLGECHQRVALRQPRLQFHPRHRAGGEHFHHSPRHGGQSIGPGENHSRVHRLCQGQSRARSTWRQAAPAVRSMSPANCSR